MSSENRSLLRAVSRLNTRLDTIESKLDALREAGGPPVVPVQLVKVAETAVLPLPTDHQPTHPVC